MPRDARAAAGQPEPRQAERDEAARRGPAVPRRGPARDRDHDSPDETGATFLENATLKALHYARALGPADGRRRLRPLGRRARRRARALLEPLRRGRGERPRPQPAAAREAARRAVGERGARASRARWWSRAAGSVLFQAQETVIGRIAPELRGTQRLRLRPALLLPAVRPDLRRGRRRQEKDRVSHRGKAFARLRAFLASLDLAARACAGSKSPRAFFWSATSSRMPLSAAASSCSHLLVAERLTLGRALDLDEAAVARLDDVHVDVGGRVLLVVEVEQDRVADAADRDRGHEVPHRQLRERALALAQPAQRRRRAPRRRR